MKTDNQITTEMIQHDLRYLELLSHNFPTIAVASTEIINLEAILKGIQKRTISNDSVPHIVERINRDIVLNHKTEYKKVFDVLLDRKNYPVVIHCTSGKGRTGITDRLNGRRRANPAAHQSAASDADIGDA